MRLRTISLLGTLVLASLFIAGEVYLSGVVVEGGFQRLEEESIRNSLSRAKRGLDNHLRNLDTFVWDWASWDDAYVFVQDGNLPFITSNLPIDTFVEQNLSAIIIWDRFGHVQYGRAVDGDMHNDPESLQRILDQCSGDLPPVPESTGGRGGLIRLGKGRLALAAKRDVLTSSGGGPAMGEMLMVRHISADILDSLSETLGFPIRIESLSSVSDPVRERLAAGEEVHLFPSEDVADGLSLLRDVDGEPVALVRVEVDRSASRQGSLIIRYNYLIIALIILAFSVLGYGMLHHRVLRRLESLGHQVRKIGRTGFESGRVSLGGEDELSELADAVNAMLGSIAASQQEARRKTRELEESEQFLGQLFNSISVGVFLVDPKDCRVVEINDPALALVGRERSEILGRSCHRLVCPSEVGNCPILDHHQPGDMSKRKLLHRDGHIVPVMKSVQRIERGGRELLLETVVDITELEASRLELERIKDGLEETVAQRTQDLEAANRDLVALDKAKTLFLSSASHELRTPLTAVIGFLKLMEKNFSEHFLPAFTEGKQAKRADTFIKNLHVVRSEADRLGFLVNDLLDLNKIESGRMEWRDEPLAPAILVERASHTISGQIAERPELELIVEVEPGLPHVEADPDRMHQVLINLLNNAVKFTEAGEIRLGAQRSERGVAFVVIDTGRGIPEEDQPRIFELFYQAQDENQRSSLIFGTGLGLAICKQIVTHYGGELSFTSTLGQGTRFVVDMPLGRS